MSRDGCYCDFCGKHISTSDLEKGRAIILMKKKYCKACLADAVRKSKDKPADKKHDSTPSNLISAPS